MNALATTEFFGTPVRIIDHAGQRWLTAEEAGLCLGYNPANARQGILKIYERHADEFTEADTFVVKLTTNPQGGNPNTRIFSGTGCIKLGFFTNTARAKDFRHWASQVLAGQPAPAVVPAATPPRPPMRMGPARITRAVENDVLTLFVQGMKQSEIARYLRISSSTVSRLLLAQHRFEPNAGDDMTTPELCQAVVDRLIAAERARLTQKFCASATNADLARRLDADGCRLLGVPETQP